ncbi:hypothetical protein BDW62DRAFT_196932 [Aspergillus aurantiobrunneus]
MRALPLRSAWLLSAAAQAAGESSDPAAMESYTSIITSHVQSPVLITTYFPIVSGEDGDNPASDTSTTTAASNPVPSVPSPVPSIPSVSSVPIVSTGTSVSTGSSVTTAPVTSASPVPTASSVSTGISVSTGTPLSTASPVSTSTAESTGTPESAATGSTDSTASSATPVTSGTPGSTSTLISTGSVPPSSTPDSTTLEPVTSSSVPASAPTSSPVSSSTVTPDVSSSGARSSDSATSGSVTSSINNIALPPATETSAVPGTSSPPTPLEPSTTPSVSPSTSPSTGNSDTSATFTDVETMPTFTDSEPSTIVTVVTVTMTPSDSAQPGVVLTTVVTSTQGIPPGAIITSTTVLDPATTTTPGDIISASPTSDYPATQAVEDINSVSGDFEAIIPIMVGWTSTHDSGAKSDILGKMGKLTGKLHNILPKLGAGGGLGGGNPSLPGLGSICGGGKKRFLPALAGQALRAAGSAASKAAKKAASDAATNVAADAATNLAGDAALEIVKQLLCAEQEMNNLTKDVTDDNFKGVKDRLNDDSGSDNDNNDNNDDNDDNDEDENDDDNQSTTSQSSSTSSTSSTSTSTSTSTSSTSTTSSSTPSSSPTTSTSTTSSSSTSCTSETTVHHVTILCEPTPITSGTSTLTSTLTCSPSTTITASGCSVTQTTTTVTETPTPTSMPVCSPENECGGGVACPAKGGGLVLDHKIGCGDFPITTVTAMPTASQAAYAVALDGVEKPAESDRLIKRIAHVRARPIPALPPRNRWERDARVLSIDISKKHKWLQPRVEPEDHERGGVSTWWLPWHPRWVNKLGMKSLPGCTKGLIISTKGVFAIHIWQSPVFVNENGETDEESFRANSYEAILNGGPFLGVDPSLSSLLGTDQEPGPMHRQHKPIVYMFGPYIADASGRALGLLFSGRREMLYGRRTRWLAEQLTAAIYGQFYPEDVAPVIRGHFPGTTVEAVARVMVHASRIQRELMRPGASEEGTDLRLFIGLYRLWLGSTHIVDQEFYDQDDWRRLEDWPRKARRDVQDELDELDNCDATPDVCSPQTECGGTACPAKEGTLVVDDKELRCADLPSASVTALPTETQGSYTVALDGVKKPSALDKLVEQAPAAKRARPYVLPIKALPPPEEWAAESDRVADIISHKNQHLKPKVTEDPATGGASTWYFAWPNRRVAYMGMKNFAWCVKAVIISRKGIFAIHLWELPIFLNADFQEVSDEQFYRNSIGTILDGLAPGVDPSLNELIGTAQDPGPMHRTNAPIVYVFGPYNPQGPPGQLMREERTRWLAGKLTEAIYGTGYPADVAPVIRGHAAAAGRVMVQESRMNRDLTRVDENGDVKRLFIGKYRVWLGNTHIIDQEFYDADSWHSPEDWPQRRDGQSAVDECEVTPTPSTMLTTSKSTSSTSTTTSTSTATSTSTGPPPPPPPAGYGRRDCFGDEDRGEIQQDQVVELAKDCKSKLVKMTFGPGDLTEWEVSGLKARVEWIHRCTGHTQDPIFPIEDYDCKDLILDNFGECPSDAYGGSILIKCLRYTAYKKK